MDFNIPINLTHEIWYVILPLILAGLDVLTGWLNAWKTNTLSSKKMREGLTKKFGELVYVTVGLIFKYATGIDGISIFLSSYICLMEIISLAENCDKLGIKMPKFLKEKVNNLNDYFSGKEDK